MLPGKLLIAVEAKTHAYAVFHLVGSEALEGTCCHMVAATVGVVEAVVVVLADVKEVRKGATLDVTYVVMGRSATTANRHSYALARAMACSMSRGSSSSTSVRRGSPSPAV